MRALRTLDLRYVILIFSALVMLTNSFSFPVKQSYDWEVHWHTIQKNRFCSPKNWKMEVGIAQLEYQAPLYYMLFGKFNHFWEVVLKREIEPFYTFRLFHIAIFLLVGWLYLFRVIPKLTDDQRIHRWAAIALFVLPNIFLVQVMVRADHLLLLILQLLIYFWFCHDFPGKLASSGWRQAVWALGLIGLANSRSFSLPAYALFLAWGLWVIARNQDRSRTWIYALKISALLLLTFVYSGKFYYERYLRTGLIFGQDTNLPYYRMYHERQIGWDRTPLFTNLQFHKLLEHPNRNADFRERSAFFPRLYNDMWGDHWLYFSGKVLEDKKVDVKRIVLVLGIVFSILYFFLPVKYAWSGFRNLMQRQAPSLPEVAGTLFTASILLLMVFVYKEPEVGKNSTVKFAYLLGYAWLPFLCLADWLEQRPRWIRPMTIYTAVLFAICLPLYFFY